MKVVIKKPKSWFGPYQLAEMLLFFLKDGKDKYGLKEKHPLKWKFGNFLNHGKFTDKILDDDYKITWLAKFLQWWYSKEIIKRKKIKIDPWDTWSADTTLAFIIPPLLRQLAETTHGSPLLDANDVPEAYRPDDGKNWAWSELSNKKENVVDCDVKNKNGFDMHDAWKNLLFEIAEAFEKCHDETWKDKYSSGHISFKSVPDKFDENGKPTLYRLERGPNDTYKCDWDGLNKEQEDIDNKIALFGKYYRSFWD